jgi:transcriptional regulator with PAS, ATPase and Fis domain
VETFHPVETDTPAGLIKDGCFEGIVGSSPAMQSLFAMIPDVAVSGANTLISGESGTGKELIARALHTLSPHRSGPFVAVNCASLPESLLESELFGHEKGAFTGADRSRTGRFELAASGTLFLDEIGEMKPDLQVKLLRVLEQRTFERVGGSEPLQFRARLIAATNQDLRLALREGRFREDLYYRLRTVPITLPPLRDRVEDIPLLVDHFIKKYNITCGKNVRSMDPKILAHLMDYDWPGNVRELERCIEHAFVFVKGPVIFQRYLPDLNGIRRQQRETHSPPPQHLDPADEESVCWALSQTRGRRREAADLLGISRTSLWRRMKGFDLL